MMVFDGTSALSHVSSELYQEKQQPLGLAPGFESLNPNSASLKLFFKLINSCDCAKGKIKPIMTNDISIISEASITTLSIQ